MYVCESLRNASKASTISVSVNSISNREILGLQQVVSLLFLKEKKVSIKSCVVLNGDNLEHFIRVHISDRKSQLLYIIAAVFKLCRRSLRGLKFHM